MSEIKYDLPEGFFDAGTVLDANHSFYQLSENLPGANVYVELHAARKGAVPTPELGTFSSTHTTARLVKQDNYNDIGGGIMTYQRHFAEVPDTNIATEGLQQITIRVADTANPTGDVSRFISLRSIVFGTFQTFGTPSFNNSPGTLTLGSRTFSLFTGIIEVYGFGEYKFANNIIYRKQIPYTAETSFSLLDGNERAAYFAEKLEEIQTDSQTINVPADSLIDYFGGRNEGLNILKSTGRGFTRQVLITLGTHNLIFEGESYSLFDGVITATQA